MNFILLLNTKNMELLLRRSQCLNLLNSFSKFSPASRDLVEHHFFSCISPQVCVYGVAAILWATAKFSLSPNQKLAMPRKLKRLLLEMAKRTPIERPTIVMAKKVLLSFESLLLCTLSFSFSSPTTSLVEQITWCLKKAQRVS